MHMSKNRINRSAITVAVAAGLSSLQAFAGTTAQPSSVVPVAGNTNGNNYATISLSGSTALRNYTTAAGFSLLPSNTTIFLSSGTFTAGSVAEQLAPTNSSSGAFATSPMDVAATRIEWHEQGSVEGVLELARDQIFGSSLPADAPQSLTVAGAAPTVSNPIWINRAIVAADNTSNANGWQYGTTGANGGTNGQSPVQLGISDVKPVQAFSVSGPASPFAVPGTAGYGVGNPAAPAGTDSSGLGVVGSRASLVAATDLNVNGRTGGIANLTSTTVAITATTFVSNPGTGLTNLSKNDAQFLQLAGRLANGATFEMTTRDVNSGTRSSAANNTGIDPSWAVGVNDGGNALVTTSPAAADNQDAIRSQTVTAFDGTSIPNATIRFSGKTAGGLVRTTVANGRMAIGTLSLPDALNGSYSGTANSGSLKAVNTPINILNYQGVTPTATTITDGTYAIWQQEQYVTVNSATGNIQGDTPNTSAPITLGAAGGPQNISNGAIVFGHNSTFKGGFVAGQTINAVSGFNVAAGTTVTRVIYNSGAANATYMGYDISGTAGTVAAVLLSDPTANASAGTFTDSGGDVANFQNNVVNAIHIAGGNIGYSTVTNPGDQLLSVGFIAPQLMQVAKAYDGGPVTNVTSSVYDINSNPNGYNDSLRHGFVTSSVGLSNSAPDLFYKQPLAASGFYGAATRGAGQQGAYGAAPQVLFTNGGIAITSSNYLFGNFANTGTRDYNSFKYSVAALTALYNSGYGVDAFDTTGSTASTAATAGVLNSNTLSDAQLNNSGSALAVGTLASALGPESTFVGQRGDVSYTFNSSTNTYTYASTAYGNAAGTGTGVSKGDLIVMGDYNGDGRFDGRDIYAMAVGTAISANVSTSSLSNVANVSSGVLRKNDALNFTLTNTSDAAYNLSGGYYVAANASAFIRQSARVILSVAGSNAPSGSVALYNTGSGSTLTTYFTYDPKGDNSFNKTDVNRDGVVDFNDVTLVDKFQGQDFSNELQSVSATQQAPVSGTTQAANLVLMKQVDDGTSVIGSADFNTANAALTGTGTTNWYGYSLNKSGTGNIIFQRSGGAVNVTSGAAFQISAGSVQVASAIDPFTDSSNSSKSVAITVATGAKLEYTSISTTGVSVDRLGGLNVAGGSVVVDSVANHANHTLLIASNVSVNSGGTIDLGSNSMIVQGGDLGAVTTLVTNGSIFSSAAAADTTHLTAVGVIANGSLYNSGNKFDGTVAPNASDILVKDTYYGDANLSGSVDSADYTAIDAGYLAGNATGWGNGDFNYDGTVNGSDYTLIDNAFNTQGSPLAEVSPSASIAAEIAPIGASSAVPEPTALGLLGVGVGSLLGRRRRRA
jgi:hypothetical protein